MSEDDAKERFDAGAELVQIYTGFIYRGPRLVREIVNTEEPGSMMDQDVRIQEVGQKFKSLGAQSGTDIGLLNS